MANDHAPPLRSEPIVNKDGTPTFRHADFLEKLGETSDVVSVSLESSINKNANIFSVLFSLQEKIGSGDFLTSDETGFTVDSTNLSVDMDEA